MMESMTLTSRKVHNWHMPGSLAVTIFPAKLAPGDMALPADTMQYHWHLAASHQAAYKDAQEKHS